MLNIRLDKETGIATLRPESALSEGDFTTAACVIEPFIEEAGKLKGLIIYTESFPGWDSFGALLKHLEFAREHHKKVSYVAIVTDSVLGDFAEKVASHFIAAEIRHFAFNELDQAQSWLVKNG